LGASGCEKLMPLFGISLCNTTSEKKFSEDDKGKLYIYKFKGTFSWQGGSIEAIGACSSRDKFFAWDGKAQEYKALSEVDEPNILKAAYSNMLMNGVTRLLGIRNLTWEQLKGFGIDPNKVARVEYGYKTKQASPDEKKKQEEISSMCMLMTEKNREKAVAYLRELSKFTAKDKTKVPGVTSTKVLTGTRLDIVHHKTKEEYQKYLKLHNLVDEVFKEAK